MIILWLIAWIGCILLGISSGDYIYNWNKGDLRLTCDRLSTEAGEWHQVGDSCFLFINSTYSQEEAREICSSARTSNGHLTRVDHWMIVRQLGEVYKGKGTFWTRYNISRDQQLYSYGDSTDTIYNPSWAFDQPSNLKDLQSPMCLGINLGDPSTEEFGWRIHNCSDRLQVLCETFACVNDDWRCGDNSRCIPRKYIKDGVRDCDDGSDENQAAVIYQAISCSDVVMTDPSGHIHSPHYPDPYPSNSKCQWSIRVPDDKIVVLYINAMSISSDDALFLKGNDGRDRLSFSGFSESLSYVSHSNVFEIQFEANGFHEKNGFSIDYVAIDRLSCEEKLTAKEGEVIYNADYRKGINCTWKIENENEDVVSLVFNSIYMDASRLQISTSSSQGRPSLTVYSSDTPPPTLFTSSDKNIEIAIISEKGTHTDIHMKYYRGSNAYLSNTFGELMVTGMNSIEKAPYSFVIDFPCDERCEFTVKIDNLQMESTDLMTITSKQYTSNVTKSASYSVEKFHFDNPPVQFKIFSGTSFTLEASYSIDCSNLVEQETLTMSTNISHLGTVVNFECASDHLMKGVESITCLHGGRWSSNPPLCFEHLAYCPLPVIKNGFPLDLTGSTTGSTLYTQCKERFISLHGQSSMYSKCTAAGLWTPEPECSIELQCEAPEQNYRNATIKGTMDGKYELPWVRYNEIFYKPDRPYVIATQNPFRQCDLNAYESFTEWRDYNFDFKYVGCYGGYGIEFGILPGMSLPGPAAPECSSGFENNNILTCTEEGNWEGERAVCVSKAFDQNACGPGIFEQQVGGYTCDCEDGYTFDGNTCSDINECALKIDLCGKYPCKNTIGSYTCDCPRGYQMYDKAHTCYRVTCPYPDSNEYIAVIVNPSKDYYYFGEQVTVYSAWRADGDAVYYNSTFECKEDGNMKRISGTFANEMFCKPVDEDRYYFDKRTYHPFEVATVNCRDAEMHEVGKDTKCGVDGNWIGELPKCTVSACPDLVKSKLIEKQQYLNVTLDLNHTYTVPGYTYRFTCLEGTVMDGNDNITCKDNLEWSDRLPLCNPKGCTLTANPLVSTVRDFIEPGEYANFQCAYSNYVLSDTSDVECLLDGGRKCLIDASTNTVVHQGDCLTLNCKFSQSCRDQVFWRFNGKRVEGTIRDHSQLIFYKEAVTEEDAGEYVCTVRNFDGEIVEAQTVRVVVNKTEYPLKLRDEVIPLKTFKNCLTDETALRAMSTDWIFSNQFLTKYSGNEFSYLIHYAIPTPSDRFFVSISAKVSESIRLSVNYRSDASIPNLSEFTILTTINASGIYSLPLSSPSPFLSILITGQGYVSIERLEVQANYCSETKLGLMYFPAIVARSDDQLIRGSCDSSSREFAPSFAVCLPNGQWNLTQTLSSCSCRGQYTLESGKCEPRGPKCYSCSESECTNVVTCGMGEMCQTERFASNSSIFQSCSTSCNGGPAKCTDPTANCLQCCTADLCNTIEEEEKPPYLARDMPICIDKQPMKIECSQGLEVFMNYGFAMPTFIPMPKIEDNDPLFTLSSNLPNLNSERYILPNDVDSIVWTATDSQAISTTCETKIVRKEVRRSLLDCPSSRVINVMGSSSPYNPLILMALTNRTDVKVATQPANGSLVNILQPQRVLVTAVDSEGYVDKCHFYVSFQTPDCPRWYFNDSLFDCIDGDPTVCVPNECDGEWSEEIGGLACSRDSGWRLLKHNTVPSHLLLKERLYSVPHCLEKSSMTIHSSFSFGIAFDSSTCVPNIVENVRRQVLRYLDVLCQPLISELIGYKINGNNLTISFLHQSNRGEHCMSELNTILEDVNTGGNSECPCFRRSLVHSRQPCPVGEVADGNTKCVRCGRGSYAFKGTCKPCPIGYYSSNEASVTCMPCPAGTLSIREGADAIDKCIEFCAPGFYSETGLAPCQPCPLSSFQHFLGSTSCLNCENGKGTSRMASVSHTDCKEECPPGTFSVDGLAPCQECPLGYFSNAFEPTNCIACGSDMTTPNSGSKSEVECVDAICENIRCRNGGVCVAGGCECPLGFTGYDCSIKVDLCSSQFCLNGGKCTFGENGNSCDCPTGIGGERCEKPQLFRDVKDNRVDEVSSSPDNIFKCTIDDCRNGYCVDGQTQLTCECFPGNFFCGGMCRQEMPPCPCLTSFTKNCISNQHETKCECNIGFSGEYCELRSGENECSPVSGTTDRTTMSSFGIHDVASTVSRTFTNTPRISSHSPVNLYSWPTPTPPLPTPPRNWSTPSANFTNTPGTSTDFSTDSYSWPTPSPPLPTQADNCSNPTTPSTAFTHGGAINNSYPLKPVCQNCLLLADTDSLYVSRTCLCSDSYDKLCNVTYDLCSNVICQNGGTCYADSTVHCNCADGFAGEFCENPVPICNTEIRKNVCLNGGTCNAQGDNQMSCTCRPEFTGDRCETLVDACDDNDCDLENTLRCLPYYGAYFCLCKDGFVGQNCGEAFDICSAANPCVNGKCLEGGKCLCDDGWEGPYCEKVIDVCAQKPCKNGGECIQRPGLGDFICACEDGWTGANCTEKIDYCSLLPCENGGTCKSLPIGYECECPKGFDGKICQITVNPCTSNTFSCGPNGQCYIDQDQNPACKCEFGFSGTFCEVNSLRACGVGRVCYNGGTCYNETQPTMSDPSHAVNVTSYCHCLPDFTGSHCETEMTSSYNLYFNGQPSTQRIVSVVNPVSMMREFTLCGWVRYATIPGKDTTLLQAIYASNGKTILALTNNGVDLDEQRNVLSLDIPLYTWHHFCIRSPNETTNSPNRPWSTFLDGVQFSNVSYPPISVTPANFLIELAPQNSAHPFRGEISYVQFYYHTLSDEEISEMAFNCSDWIHGKNHPVSISWFNFTRVHDTNSGVTVIYPGICVSSNCPPGNSNCNSKDKIPPVVTECPSEIRKISSSRLTKVTWNVAFDDNVGVVSVNSNYRSGQYFPWGIYHVVTIAEDRQGNQAKCAFDIVIAQSDCLDVHQPSNATITLLNVNGKDATKIAIVNCTDQDYPKMHPDFYVCDYMGQWERMYDMPVNYKGFTPPGCGTTVDPLQTVNGTLTKTGNCLQMHDDIEKILKETVNEKCQVSPDCQYNLSNPCTGGSSRRKRADEEYVFHFTVVINETRDYVKDDVSRKMKSEICENCFSIHDKISCTNQDYPQPHLRGEKAACANCPVGKIWDPVGEKCVWCPQDEYYEDPGKCVHCPPGTTTGNDPGLKEIDCYTICLSGEYYNYTSKTCEKCELGTYQPKKGTLYCLQCPAGTSTLSTGADSVEQCTKNFCKPGNELQDGPKCVPCQVGTYKGKNDDFCKDCPQGLTTWKEECSTENDCNILNCPLNTYVAPNPPLPIDPSKFTSEIDQYCLECKNGYFSDTLNATSCTPCESVNSNTKCAPTNECSPSLKNCPKDQTCEKKPMGYKCVAASVTVMSHHASKWWIAIIVVVIVIIAVVVAVFVIAMYKGRLKQLLCCKKPWNKQNMESEDYHRPAYANVTSPRIAVEALPQIAIVQRNYNSPPVDIDESPPSPSSPYHARYLPDRPRLSSTDRVRNRHPVALNRLPPPIMTRKESLDGFSDGFREAAWHTPYRTSFSESAKSSDPYSVGSLEDDEDYFG